MKKIIALVLSASILILVIGCANPSSSSESQLQNQTVQNSEESSQSSESSLQISQSSSASSSTQASKPSYTPTVNPSTTTTSKSSSTQSSVALVPTPDPEPVQPEAEPITATDIYGIYQCYAISHSEYEDLSFIEWTITEDALFERGIGYMLFDKACEEGWGMEEGETKEDAWQRLQINQQSLIYQGVRYVMSGGGGTVGTIISITTDSIRCDWAGETKTISFSYDKEHGRLTALESGLVFEKIYQ